MPRRKVVLTGAAGYVAGRMLSALRKRYELVLLDVKKTNRGGEEVAGVVEVDLLDRNWEFYREHFQGADAVVHCGFVREHPDGAYWAEASNIHMAHNVYMTCLEEKVRRAVVISSNHAADYYEHLIWQDKMGMVTPAMTPLSDNFYGWAKASYELLAFPYACGIFGRQLETVMLRLNHKRKRALYYFDSFLG